jgi:hypothetical protein
MFTATNDVRSLHSLLATFQMGRDISNLHGIPLLAENVIPPQTVLPSTNTPNGAAELLHRGVTSDSILMLRANSIMIDGGFFVQTAFYARGFAGITGFGSFSERMATEQTGDVYVARADAKPLPKEHLEALLASIEQDVEPKLAVARKCPEVKRPIEGQEEVLNAITKANSRCFDKTMMEENLKQGVKGWAGSTRSTRDPSCRHEGTDGED